MKRTVFSIILLGSLLLSLDRMYSQEVIISGELRPRYEYQHGYKTLFPDGEIAGNFVSQRTRLNAYYANTSFVTYLSLQDVRVWGDVDQLNTKDINGLAIHEAWGQIKFYDFLSLKLGRQEIIYDDQRIFGSVDWAQQARSHDAAIFKFSFAKKNKLDIGFAYNAMRETIYKVDYTKANYKTIQWLHYHLDFGKSGLSFLFLNNGLAYDNNPVDTIVEQKVAFSQTFGPRYTYKNDKININAAAYYQGGKNAKNKNLSAYYFAAEVNFSLVKSFTFGLGGEYLSGTPTIGQADKNKNDQSFLPLYGTNHKFNGFMDYFFVGNHAGNVGLMDIFLPLKYTIKKITFQFTPHYFMSAATVSSLSIVGGTETWVDYSNGLGTEIDFTINWAVTNSVAITGGYSQMFATETMQVVKYPKEVSADYYQNTNNWAYIMVIFKPTFFKKEIEK
jgi:hypothetical protein